MTRHWEPTTLRLTAKQARVLWERVAARAEVDCDSTKAGTLRGHHSVAVRDPARDPAQAGGDDMNWLETQEARAALAERVEMPGEHLRFTLALLREALALLQPSVADVTLHGRDVADWHRRRDALVAAAEKGPG